MEPKIIIAPSILSADFANLKQEIASVSSADWIHVDVMDGHFVPNLTIGPVVVHWIRKATPLFLDTHLMITEPHKYVDDFINAGSDGITFHVESDCRPKEMIRQIKARGKRAGISLRPKTSLDKIMPFIAELDLVLVMTVEPGFGGQKFMPDMMEKVKALRSHIDSHQLNCRIEVDGGISASTAPLAVREGADALVAGNAIFAQSDRSLAIKQIRDSIDNSQKNI